MLLGLKIAATGFILLYVAKSQMGKTDKFDEMSAFDVVAILVAYFGFWAIVVGLLMAIWGM